MGKHARSADEHSVVLSKGNLAGSRRRQARLAAQERAAASPIVSSVRESATEVLDVPEVSIAVARSLTLGEAERTAQGRRGRSTGAHLAAPQSNRTHFMRALTASAVVVTAGTFSSSLIVGTSYADTTPTPSLVKAANASATTPEALKGSATATQKAAANSAAAAMEANPGQCVPKTATTMRAAFVSTNQKIVFPLARYTLTSRFGIRSDPMTGVSSFHAGDDFAAPLGTPIHAIADGVVTHAGAGIEGRSNNLIIIEHTINGKTYESWYVHMYDNGVLVKEGQEVKAGDVIGLVGSNGKSTGPHLHLEIHDMTNASAPQDGTKAVLKDVPYAFLKKLGAVNPEADC